MAIITLSRQSGSEGNQITRLLCERLGYRYFDKNLMHRLAAESGMQPSEIADASADAYQMRSWWERAFANFVSPFSNPSSWSLGAQEEARQALSVQQVRKLIDAAYQHGNIVIVGRGGQIALAGKPDVLHVRVIAPQETRIRRWQEREGLSYADARAKVSDRDEAHADFVRRFFDADVNDPANYDLVINTKKMIPASAVELIIRALEALKEKG